MQMSGKIEVIFGPMFSGKSTELQRRVRRYRHANMTCLVLNFYLDNRYSDGNFAVTHDREKIDAQKLKRLSDLSDEDLNSHQIIGIDEGQFFDDLVEKAEEWANMGKTVIVAALDSTFERKPFKSVCNLVAMAEFVKKLTAKCVLCHSDASFTQRTVTSTRVRLVGGAESYRPVCRGCYLTSEPFMHHAEAERRQSNEELSTDSDPGTGGDALAHKTAGIDSPVK